MLFIKCSLFAHIEQDPALTLMSYNVENLWSSTSSRSHFSFSECPSLFRRPFYQKKHVHQRIDHLVDLIQEQKPDVVCLNEVEYNGLTSEIGLILQKRLRSYDVFWPDALPKDVRVRGVLVLSRLPFVQSFSFEEKKYGSSVWASPRSLFVRFQVALKQRAYLDVFCLHWTSRYQKTAGDVRQSHDESVDNLIETASRLKNDQIWQVALGDFNEPPHGQALAKLQEVGWQSPEQHPSSCSYWYRGRCQNYDQIFWNPPLPSFVKTITKIGKKSLLNGDFYPLRWQVKHGAFSKKKPEHLGVGFSDHLPILVSTQPFHDEKEQETYETCQEKKLDPSLWSSYENSCAILKWSDLPRLETSRFGYLVKWANEKILIRFLQVPSWGKDELKLCRFRLVKSKGRLGWFQGMKTIFVDRESDLKLVY
jgi:endonuclease/exonuclease/phosphatase family metal-dependent hydrolase